MRGFWVIVGLLAGCDDDSGQAIDGGSMADGAIEPDGEVEADQGVAPGPLEPADPCLPAEAACEPEGRWQLFTSREEGGDLADQTFDIGRDAGGALTTTLQLFGAPADRIRLDPGCRLVVLNQRPWVGDGEGGVQYAGMVVDVRGDFGRGWAGSETEVSPQNPESVRLVRAGVNDCAEAPARFDCVPQAAFATCDSPGGYWRVDRAEAPDAACTAPAIGVDLFTEGDLFCAGQGLRLLATEGCGVYAEVGGIDLVEGKINRRHAIRIFPEQDEARVAVDDAACAAAEVEPIHHETRNGARDWRFTLVDLPGALTEGTGDPLFRIDVGSTPSRRRPWDFQVQLNDRGLPVPCTFADGDADGFVSRGDAFECVDGGEVNVLPGEVGQVRPAQVYAHEPDGRTSDLRFPMDWTVE